MKLTFLKFSLLFCSLFLFSCAVKQQPVAYGQANCAHCQMTVSDQRYGSELVTKTGKAFFFDSAECMLLYYQENPEVKEKTELLLVSDFNKPGTLVEVNKATFLQSKMLPSPMGMFLTAFGSEAEAKKMQQQSTGKLMNWNEALAAVKNKTKPE